MFLNSIYYFIFLLKAFVVFSLWSYVSLMRAGTLPCSPLCPPHSFLAPPPPAAYIQNKANFPFHQPCLFMGFWTGSTLTSTSGYNSSNSSKHIYWNQPGVDALLPLVAIGVTAFSESWQLRGSYTDKEQTCEIAPHCTDTKIYVNLLSFHKF